MSTSLGHVKEPNPDSYTLSDPRYMKSQEMGNCMGSGGKALLRRCKDLGG